MWEVRGAPRHFTFSKIMSWDAFDRGIKSIEQYGLEGPLDHWKELRAPIVRRSSSTAMTPSATPSSSIMARAKSTPRCC